MTALFSRLCRFFCPPSSISGQHTPRKLIALLTLLILFVQGYHPWANDAGVYIAGVRKLVDPGLYASDAPFITTHTNLSIFAPLLANFIRLTHVNFAWTIFVVYLLAVALFLYACWQLATRLFASIAARVAALFMAAALYSLPVSGTALAVMSPYLTARSFSTPIDLLAVSAALDRRYFRTAILILLAFIVHPLMAAYAFAFVTVMIAFDREYPRIAIALCASGPTAAAIADFAVRHRPISAAYRMTVLQHAHRFLFLSRWHAYEITGAILPLLLLGLAAHRLGWRSPTGSIALASIATGTSSLIIAAFFVPAHGPYLLVPLQVMRIDHIIYAIGLVLLGGLIGYLGTRRRWLAPAFFTAAFIGMAIAASLAFPACRHVEWPGLAPKNPWSRAFVWIRYHTPPNAIFAFNPRLIYQPLEDQQGFRVLSERSHLAGDKDAGVVTVFPSLANRWARDYKATLHINTESDAQRIAHLAPLYVTWILLPPSAKTHFPCPYQNRVTKVCRLAH